MHFKLNLLLGEGFLLKKNEKEQKNYKTTKDRLKDMIDDNAAVLKLLEKFELNLD